MPPQTLVFAASTPVQSTLVIGEPKSGKTTFAGKQARETVSESGQIFLVSFGTPTHLDGVQRLVVTNKVEANGLRQVLRDVKSPNSALILDNLVAFRDILVDAEVENAKDVRRVYGEVGVNMLNTLREAFQLFGGRVWATSGLTAEPNANGVLTPHHDLNPDLVRRLIPAFANVRFTYYDAVRKVFDVQENSAMAAAFMRNPVTTLKS